MSIIHEMGQTAGGLYFILVQDAHGEPRAILGTPDVFEDFARDLLDLVRREYCLPHICDHLEVAGRHS